MNTKIIVITQRYPFGKGEVYMEREIEYLSQEYSQVIILPIDSTGEARKVKKGVVVDSFYEKRTGVIPKKLFLNNFGLIFSVFLREFLFSGKKRFLIKNLKKYLAVFLICLEDSKRFEEVFLSNGYDKMDFYSVWMDEGAIMLAILKKKKKIRDFVFRLHGYDLYDDRRKGGYMPFRYFCFKYVKRIFIVSKMGENYLRKKGLFVSKLEVNYSGVYDHGLNPKRESNNEFVICSCSNIIPLKRVHLIARILRELKFPVRWIHLGGGDGIDVLKSEIAMLPSHVNVELRGHISFDEVLATYRNESIDLFIHLSETEGLPLSLVEAMSFGIPVIATDAGGTNEIVNEKNGVLLPVTFNIENAVREIVKFRDNENYWLKKKEEARRTYKEHFAAEKNYPNFVQRIKQN